MGSVIDVVLSEALLQVVISYIVEAFVLQLEEANHTKEKEKQKNKDSEGGKDIDDADCVESVDLTQQTQLHAL